MKTQALVALAFSLLLAGCGASRVAFPIARPGVASSPLVVAGDLHRPEGSGPFPALVLLHGSNGISSYQSSWAQRLAAHGYVALLLDSFGPRSIAEAPNEIVADRVWDAYGALLYLRSLPFVDGRRVGVMGWSQGGMVALRSANDGLAKYVLNAGGFRAAIALYPYCGGYLTRETSAPVMLLLGADDDWTPPAPCLQIAREFRDQGKSIEWMVYPAATHGFDGEWSGTYRGHVIRPDRVAATDAEQRVLAFLRKHLR